MPELTTDELVARLRGLPDDVLRWTESLLGLCATSFDMTHSPPSPMDGTVDASALLLLNSQMGPKTRDLIPDMRRRVRAVSAMDDVVVLSHVTTGTLPDGTSFRIPGVYVLTIRDGRIEKMHDWHDPEDSTAYLAFFSSLLADPSAE